MQHTIAQAEQHQQLPNLMRRGFHLVQQAQPFADAAPSAISQRASAIATSQKYHGSWAANARNSANSSSGHKLKIQ